MKSVFYKRILLPTQDLTASVSSQPTTPTPTNPVAVSYTICGNYKLYGLTNYLDTFNATTKVITHKIGIKVLDGTENWTKRSDTGVNRYQATILNDKVSGTINGLSSHFVSVLAYSQLLDGCFILDATDRVIFDKEDITTASAFKSYLSQQYANGTPVIIYYPLATETTETATEPLQRVETKSFVQYKANPEYRNLPSGYTQVKYLESSGTQWIDTMLKAQSNLQIETNYQFLSNTTTNRLFGGRNSGDSNLLQFGVYQGRYFPAFANTTYSMVQSVDLLKHKLTFINNVISLYDSNGTLQETYSFPNNGFLSTCNIGLFCINASNSSTPFYGNVKIFDFSIKENNQLVRDLVPCYNSNNVAGMYDIADQRQNLFTRQNQTNSAYIDTTGNVITGDSRFFATDFIEVKPNTTYMYMTNSMVNSNAKHCWYDENKQFISYMASGKFASAQTSPSNAKYIRFSNRIAGTYFLFYEGTTTPFYTNSGTGTFIVGEPVSPLVRVEEKGFAMYQLNPNWHDLPSDYTELEYLESSGTQYINLQKQNTATSKFYLKTYITADLPTTGSIIGANAVSYENLIYYRSSSGPYSHYFGNYTAANLPSPTNQLFEITADYVAKTLTINSNTYTSTAQPVVKNLYLFGSIGHPSTTTIDIYSAQRVYNFEYWNNDVLALDLIPARNSNNILGMYDLVSGQFYTNAGTGTFIAGNVVPKYIKHGG